MLPPTISNKESRSKKSDISVMAKNTTAMIIRDCIKTLTVILVLSFNDFNKAIIKNTQDSSINLYQTNKAVNTGIPIKTE